VVAACDTNAVAVNYPQPIIADRCCTNGFTTIYNPPSGTPFAPPSTNTVEVTVFDGCGHTNTCSFTVTVLQIGGPAEITSAPASVPVCLSTNGCGTLLDYTGQVMVSPEGGPVNVTQNPPPGAMVCENVNTSISFIVQNSCGFISSTNAPLTYQTCSNCLVVACPSDIAVTTCSNGVNVCFPPPGIGDLCCSNAAYAYTPGPCSLFPAGVTPVQLTVTDACGNFAACSFTVTVLPATNPVVFLSTNNFVVSACSPNDCAMVDATGELTVSNISGIPYMITQTPPAGTLMCGNTNGTSYTNVVLTYSNDCGFVTNFNLPVTLELSCPGTNSCITFNGPNGTNIMVMTCSTNPVPVFYPTFCPQDNCSCGGVDMFYCPPSGSLFPPGTSQVFVGGMTACDTNFSPFYVTVIVTNPPPPVITNAPSNIAVCAGSTVSGRVMVDSGPWDLSSYSLCQTPDEVNYLLNVAAFLTHGSSTSNILIYTTDFNIYGYGVGDLLVSKLEEKGYHVTLDAGLYQRPDRTFYWGGFAEPLYYYLENPIYHFDAVFLGGLEWYVPPGVSYADACTEYLYAGGCSSPSEYPNQASWANSIPAVLNYITNGGGVYIAAGIGNPCGGNDGGIGQWNAILNPFGLAIPANPQNITCSTCIPYQNTIAFPNPCPFEPPNPQPPCGTNAFPYQGTNLSVAGGTLTVLPSPVMNGVDTIFYAGGVDITITYESPIAQIVAFSGSHGLIGVSGCLVPTNNGCGVMTDITGLFGTDDSTPVTVSQSIPPGTSICEDTNVVLTVSGECGYVTTNVPVTLGNCSTNSCLSIQWSNSVLYTCSNCASVASAPVVTDSCCSNFTYKVEPPLHCYTVNSTNQVVVLASDDCGNYVTKVYSVAVLEGNCCTNTTPPTITCPSNIVVTTACSCVQVYFDVPAQSQFCSNLTVVSYPPSGSFFCLGTNTVTSVATDCCGNSNSCSFTVTVNPAPSCVAGITWSPQTSGSYNWQSVASSSDGSKLVGVVYGGQVYTSTDFGVTWTARASAQNWFTVASSSDGSKLVAAAAVGQIYTSTDSGVTWTAQNSGSRSWQSVASSSDGSKLVAVEYAGQIYTSTDSGVTWTARASVGNWRAVASSADGSKLVAAAAVGQIYTSTDSGVTWTAQNSGSRYWLSIVSSSDGSKLVAAVDGGQIYTSSDSGVTWTAQNSGSQNWISVASSSDGSKLVAVVDGGQIYTSSDSGVTWTAQNSGSQNWISVASSSDGSKLVAAVNPGQIYTSDCTPTPCCVPPPTNMVLWLPFDETSGNTSANLASPANPGAQIGNPTPFVGQHVANSLFFNGSNYVVVPDYPGIEIGTNSLTIDAWVDLTGTAPSNYVILDKGGVSSADTSTGYSLWLSTNLLIFFVPSGFIQDTTPISGGQWHFIALSLSHDASKPSFFYVDGAVTSSFAGGLPDLSNTNSLWIGASHPGSAFTGGTPWIGGLDEVEIYDRTLSTNELNAIYSAGAAGKCKPCCYLKVLTISRVTSSTVEVNWGGCGILEQAPDVRGPWTPVLDAPSPYVIPITGLEMFYRLVCP